MWRIKEKDNSKMTLNFFFLLSVIYFERERKRAGEGQRARETERIPSRLRTISTEPNMGLELTNHEFTT